MLNLHEIAARIKQPELCNVQDIDSLRTLCETYPYSQVFPLLYLKTLAQTNDVRLDTELQKFAYRVADRAVLFDLLNNKKAGQVKESVTPAEAYTTREESPEYQLPVENVAEEPREEISSPEPSVSLPEERAEHTDTATPLSGEETEIHTPETETNEHVQEPLPSLPDDILSSISIGAEVYSLEAEEAKIVKQKEAEEQLELEKEKQKLIEALAQKKPLIEEKPHEEKTTDERSFTSWLKKNAAYIKPVEEKPDPDALIERFIQSEPKISSPKEKLFEDRTDKNEMFNPTKKAKESLDETQLPVSETLAKIFAAQGNYPKAIYAYQQLMLIFPEKKVFFATQIEDLNKKINT